MEQEKKTRAASGLAFAYGSLRFYPPLLGAGIFFGIFLCVMRFYSYEVTRNDSFDLFYFVEAVGIGIVAFSLVVIIGVVLFLKTSLGDSSARFKDVRWKRMAAFIGSLAFLVGVYFIIPMNVGGGLPTGDPSFFGCMIGVGSVIVGVFWGNAYARLDSANILINSAFSIAIAGVIHSASGFLGLSIANIVFLLVFFGGACILLYRSIDTEFDTEAHTTLEIPDSSQAEAFAVQARKAAASLWMPLVGACLSSFIFGLTWNPVTSDEYNRSVALANLSQWIELLGPLVAMLPIIILAMLRPNSSSLRTLNQVIYPIAVALLLALPVLSVGEGALDLILEILKKGSFSIVAVAIWCCMVIACKNSTMQSYLLFPFCFILLALCFLLGHHLIYLIGTFGRTLCIILFAIYLALIPTSFALANKDEKRGLVDSESRNGQAANSKDFITARCAELAQKYALSPREQEVLFYLGRGYNHPYTASRLYISENTVRTHVKHIYSKLGIESREELIELIDAAE